MNSFWKTTLAVVCGIILTSVLSSILFFVMVGALAAVGSAVPSVPSNAVLKIDMSHITLAEQSKEGAPSLGFTGSSFNASNNSVIGLWEATRVLDKAAEDPAVKLIYIKPDATMAGVATLQEFRAALQNCRNNGKSIVAYTEAPTTGGYYLASVADKIYMPPYTGATPMLTGMSSSLFFIKDLLDKFGVNVQLIRHGKYKSAGEMFIRNSASPENLEQNQVMVNTLWKSLADEIAQSRTISTEALNDAIDNLTLNLPQDYIQAGLVDELLDRQALEQKIADLVGVKKFKNVHMVSLADYCAAKAPELDKVKSKEKLAIIFADGEIIDGYDKQQVAGDNFASIIEKVRADSSVKAVVLRVNSPGGSVMASEKIKAELDLLKQEKLLVASYGDYAASGGYWISNAAEKIFCDATTLTGSIGCFGMVPDFSKTYKDVAHINVTPVKSNKHSDMFSLTRPLDAQEYAFMQRGIEAVYEGFLANVAAGRKMTTEAVDEIGQGRVWAGADAIGIGLVDEIGTLKDAVNYTLEQSGLGDLGSCKVVCYPKPASAMEEALAMFSKTNQDADQVLLNKVRELSKPVIIARMPYEIVFE